MKPPRNPFAPTIQEEMAIAFHTLYVASSSGRLPAGMRPWPKLDETFRRANLEQARYAVDILDAAGFGTPPISGAPVVFDGFTDDEVERMAEMEHGRWDVERLRDGWRYGKPRDDGRKVDDCLVSWADLPESIKHYDRDAMRAIPAILACAGLEVFRK